MRRWRVRDGTVKIHEEVDMFKKFCALVIRNPTVRLTVLLLFLAGCASPNATVTPPHLTAVDATPSPAFTSQAINTAEKLTITPTLEATRTATFAPRVTATTKLTNTPTSTATPNLCPGLDNAVASHLGELFPPLLSDIAKYIEEAKPVTELAATFSRKSDQTNTDLPMDYNVGAIVVDLVGDGHKDIVISIFIGNFMFSQSGAFVFRECAAGSYSVHYLGAESENDPVFASTVSVMPAQLLANGSTQLIVSYGDVFSGRCLAETYLVLGLEDNFWKTYLRDYIGCDDRDIAIVGDVLVSDPDQDGRRGIAVTGTRWTGWGIYQFASRSVRLTYAWQGNELQLAKRDFLPSAYRFHALEDAQIALDAGDVELALTSYQKAASDDSLKDSLSWFEFENLDFNLNDTASMTKVEKIAHQYQTAFAYFRIIMLSASLENSSQLNQRVKQIMLLYPAENPGHEFAELAGVFQDEFGNSASRSQACEKVNKLIEDKYPHLTGPNGHVGNWGDQGEFTIDVICPK